MPRIRLSVDAASTTPVNDGTNPPFALEVIRVRARARFAGAIERAAVVDTGSPLTVIAKTVWALAPVRASITWLQFPPGLAVGRALPQLNIAGRTLPYRLGRVPIEVYDPSSGFSLPAVPVVAQLLEDDPLPNRPPLRVEVVLGLTRGVLDDRYLVARPAADAGRREAWVQDGPPA